VKFVGALGDDAMTAPDGSAAPGDLAIVDFGA